MPVIQVSPLKTSFNFSNLSLNNTTSTHTDKENFSKSDLLNQKAHNVVIKQFKKDAKITQTLDTLQEKADKLNKHSQELAQRQKELSQTKQQLMKENQITSDSPEEKQLRQVEKITFASRDITPEEEDALTANFTEYQKSAYTLDKAYHGINEEYKRSENERAASLSQITGIAIDHSASHGMFDAMQEADQLKNEVASSSIVEIFSEVKENIDETFKENEEKAAETHEEEETEKIKNEEIKEQREALLDQLNQSSDSPLTIDPSSTKNTEILDESSSLPNDLQNMLTDYTQTKNTLVNLVKNSTLTIDDLKGLEIDAEI